VETSGNPEVLAHAVAELSSVPFEPQPITEEFVTVSNGHHETNLNGHHDQVHENGANGKMDGEIETNGHVNENSGDAASLKKKNAEASNEPLPTEA
jgi:hypothetical protein